MLLDLVDIDGELGAHTLDRVKFVLNATHSDVVQVDFLVDIGKLLVEDRMQVLDCSVNGLLEHGDSAFPLVASILILRLANSEISVKLLVVIDN